MIEKTRAYAFLAGKLAQEDLKIFLSFVQSPATVSLHMNRETAQHLVEAGLCAKSMPGQVTFQIRGQNLVKNLIFPDDHRVQELWRTHVGTIWVEILHRNADKASLMIRTVTGVPASLRQKFLAELAKETSTLT